MPKNYEGKTCSEAAPVSADKGLKSQAPFLLCADSSCTQPHPRAARTIPEREPKPLDPQLHPSNQTSSFLSNVRDIPAFAKTPPREDHGPTLMREDSPMGFLLGSKAEGIWERVPPRQPLRGFADHIPAANSHGFADHIPAASGSRLEPASLGSLSVGARSLGKGCQPSAHSPTRRPVPMCCCPAQRPRRGDVPGSSPALSKAWTEERSQCCLLCPEGCAFFFVFLEASFPTAPFTSREKQPQNVTELGGNSPWGFGNVWGKNQKLKKKKKKKHTPFFLPSVFVSQPNTQQW